MKAKENPSLLIKTKSQNYLVNTSNVQEIKTDYDKLKILTH